MFTGRSEKTWEYFGKKDPYFGVLTADKFRNSKLTDDAKHHFFELGTRYVDFTLGLVREHLDPSFAPRRGLDFGCGVGRLTIPLAKVCQTMVGVDVSESMLAEAARNCDEQGLSNTTFLRNEDGLASVPGPFDFVNSFIVFQHIPPEEGEAIAKRMFELLEEDGIGVLHFTSSWSSETSLARRLLSDGYRAFPLLFSLRNLLRGRPFREPLMQMNRYDLNRLLRLLQESGCHRVHVRFTDTGHHGERFYGVIILFQKRAENVRAFG